MEYLLLEQLDELDFVPVLPSKPSTRFTHILYPKFTFLTLTCPIITSLISDGFTFARLMASLITTEPKIVAGVLSNDPWKLPKTYSKK